MLFYQGIGRLVFIDKIMDSKKYLNIPSDNFKAFTEVMELKNFIFQQDNDPKHILKTAKKFLEYKNVVLLPWTTRSLVPNPIEQGSAKVRPFSVLCAPASDLKKSKKNLCFFL
jgi:hypothetical protein